MGWNAEAHKICEERLDRYKAYLATNHGADLAENIPSALENVNDAIGYEEK